ncbi:MAG: acetoacetate decarboxylase family protein [Actinomycetota bacterium]
MTVVVQGRTLEFPIVVRKATTWSAQFLVPMSRAQELVPKGLEPATMFGKAILALAFVRYEDGDLDAYNEFAVSFAVKPHDRKPKPFDLMHGKVCAYIRHLPVDQPFTMEAGRSIWGYPKWLARIDIATSNGVTSCGLRDGDAHVLTLSVDEDGPIPLPQRPIPTYSDAEGTLNRTPWLVTGNGGARLRGARITLGDGEIASELRSLGLPKHAFMSNTIRNVHAEFGEPVPVLL